MKVVFLNPSGQLGGAERGLLEFMASLRAAEPDWELELVATADGPFVARAAALGVGTVVLPLPDALAELGDGGEGARRAGLRGRLALAGGLLRGVLPGLAYVRRLRRILRDAAPDVVHTNGFKMHVLGARARPRGVPVVWHVQDFVSRRPVMSRLLRAHAGRCAAVVAISRSVAADVRAVCGDLVPVHPVYSAVDLEAFTPGGPAADLDAAAGLPAPAPGTVRVGLVAVLAWWKGHETFLRAVSLLPRGLPFRAYVVGGPLYVTGGSSQLSLDGLRKRAEELGVADRVGFTGFVQEPAAAMRALDVVVHASTEPEPFGMVIVEAMACGRALVGSEGGGAAELISAGENALGHPPGDARRLAECIETLVRDAELRARLGRVGRAEVERSFDRRRLAAELVPIYREALAGAG
ncbi:MAG TPA: glycosyltransferase family 4 protein [Longimicrobiaceae bacterium]|nr:glycosyltransferase family 4 protein [Longimicrobiaceae bacterium]